MKLFSGEESLALKLQEQIEAIGISTVLRNNNQANAGTTTISKKAVELFIQETDFHKANPIVEEFRLNL